MTDGKNERYTPAEVVARCAALAGVPSFDLDPAASAKSHHAPRWFGVADNGLEQPWAGNVWLNPPFDAIAAWVSKAFREVQDARASLVAVLLPANRTEQGWWQQLIEPRMVAPVEGVLARVHHLPGRVRFIHPETGHRMGSPNFGCCCVVFTRHFTAISQPRGRPRSVTPELLREGRALLSDGWSVRKMVERLGVEREAWYRAEGRSWRSGSGKRARRDKRALSRGMVDQVRRLRKQGLTLKAIGERTGLHLNTVYKYVRAASAPSKPVPTPPPT